ERHDVWLALVGARQSAKMRTGQHVQTLLSAQFLDQHDYGPPRPPCGGIYLRCWRIGIHIQLFTTRATGDWQPGESFHQKSGAHRVEDCLRQCRGAEVYPAAPSACRCEATFFGRPFAILSEFEKTIRLH